MRNREKWGFGVRVRSAVVVWAARGSKREVDVHEGECACECADESEDVWV